MNEARTKEVEALIIEAQKKIDAMEKACALPTEILQEGIHYLAKMGIAIQRPIPKKPADRKDNNNPAIIDQ